MTLGRVQMRLLAATGAACCDMAPPSPPDPATSLGAVPDRRLRPAGPLTRRVTISSPAVAEEHPVPGATTRKSS
ncbi:hypothetical protein GCM10010166_32980 [Couchioplanes caeruleus subsp. azureus]|nr:hypothetical protein GCM10010166_32980 [Couchioplanes caeruleus subsp. azureus]